MKTARTAEKCRSTRETDVRLFLDLDGDTESSQIESGIGFLDHMLALFSCHSGIELRLSCDGDTEVDDHHSVEDIGIALGQAVREALGDKRGIQRYGSCLLPMDESLVLCALDLSGRGGLHYALDLPTEKIGRFDSELIEEFMNAFAMNAEITLHLRQLAGRNSHHIAEAGFKALGRALRLAVSMDSRFRDRIPSSKGTL